MNENKQNTEGAGGGHTKSKKLSCANRRPGRYFAGKPATDDNVSVRCKGNFGYGVDNICVSYCWNLSA